MPRKKYEQVHDGVPYFVNKNENYDQCCDCGLIHRVKYAVLDRRGNKIKNTRIRVTVWREERATAAVRRSFKYTKDDE